MGPGAILASAGQEGGPFLQPWLLETTGGSSAFTDALSVDSGRVWSEPSLRGRHSDFDFRGFCPTAKLGSLSLYTRAVVSTRHL